MSSVFSSGLTPDPYNALDVLAFLLCPVRAFAPTAEPQEIAAVAEILGPVRAEALRRWQTEHALRQRN